MLPNTMRAVVAYGVNDYRFEPDFPVPRIGEKGDILLKVTACGICAGDLKAFDGGERFWGGSEFDAYVEPPCVPGHEFFGEIVHLHPDDDSGLAVGDCVIPEQIVPCGECTFCKNGRYWLCGPHNVFGFKHYLNGGMAQYALLPAGSFVHRVPAGFSTEQALLIEPFACSWHAVERGRVEPGDVVVVSGAGTLGLGMVAALAMRRDCRIVSLDVNPARLPLASALGAERALNPRSDDIQAVISGMTNGDGCDVYIECAGHPSSVTQGLKLIRKAGRFVEFSVFGEKTTTDWSIIGDAKELDIYGASLSPHCFPRVIKAMSTGALRTEGVVTHVFPIEEFAAAFSVARGEGVKVALKAE